MLRIIAVLLKIFKLNFGVIVMYKKSLLVLSLLCVGALFSAPGGRGPLTDKKDRFVRALRHDVNTYLVLRKKIQQQAERENWSKARLEYALDQLARRYSL